MNYRINARDTEIVACVDALYIHGLFGESLTKTESLQKSINFRYGPVESKLVDKIAKLTKFPKMTNKLKQILKQAKANGIVFTKNSFVW